MKFKIYLTIVAMVSSCAMYAREISGRVQDVNGEPLVGSAVWWGGTNLGVSSDQNGCFSINSVKGYDMLYVSYVGYATDSLTVSASDSDKIIVTLQNADIETVVVTGHLSGNYVTHDGIMKGEMISFAGLCKMACCNLAESFENSASVTVGYSDAISGARQIKMLGLAGTYTQILDENRPIMRGLSAPYGLSYTPGMWLNSIQVSKGISSVTAGHDAVTGQINLEYRKPTDDEKLFLNLFLNDELRPEINVSSAFDVSKDGRLSSIVMFHGSADTSDGMDHNSDGFKDMPTSRQFNLSNRWLYEARDGTQLRWGFNALQENRYGGMMDYSEDMMDDMLSEGIYGSGITNKGASAYVKLGKMVGSTVYDAKNSEQLRSNIALVADFEHFNEDAYFGLNDYLGEENSVSINLMYNHYFTPRSSIIVGLSSHFQKFSERLSNVLAWSAQDNYYDFSRSENEFGAYAEYTLKLDDKFSFITGARVDYNSYFDRAFFTPRGQLKWSLSPTTTFRASAGMGYRTSNVITDNIGILATGRSIVFDQGFDENFDRQEKALTYGASFMQTFSLAGYNDATISVDYFRTEFYNQVIADQEMDADYIHIYNTDGRSYTDSYQVDFSWTVTSGLDIFATYRYTNSSITLNREDGSTYELERSLVSRSKALLNVQYATPYRKWIFDVTAQINGKMRLPAQDGDLSTKDYSPSYPMFYAQVSRRIRNWDIYLGCENIANYTQDTPILNADDPFSSGFNSSVVWGPLMGRKFYVGARFNLY